jgi:thioredoxin reductase
MTRSIKVNKHNIVDQKKLEREHQGEQGFTDVAIVGAGFAGLSAALMLGRYLRTTVIFDGGKSRNYTSNAVHGYLGFENSSPENLVQKAWKDVVQYRSVKVIRERVVKVTKTKIDDANDFFELVTQSGKTLTRARYMILATGVEDVKPNNIKNFEKFDGNGAWHCPHCDGFEATEKRLAVITHEKTAIPYAKELLGWTRKITVFIRESQQQITNNVKEEAEALGIQIVDNDDIIQISGNKKGGTKTLLCKSGTCHKVDVIFYYLGYKPQNQIARQLGCELDDEDGFVKVNSLQETTVRKVYAAGDIDTDRHYVVLAAASGALAAISIYEEMLKDSIKNLMGKGEC